jgi:hypothetical protein
MMKKLTNYILSVRSGFGFTSFIFLCFLIKHRVRTNAEVLNKYYIFLWSLKQFLVDFAFMEAHYCREPSAGSNSQNL